MENKPDITAIILTYDEAIHIRRVIESAFTVARRVIIVDSFSNDETIAIATSMGTEVFQNAFVNQAQQVQWAMDNCNITTAWTMRMDADEYLTPDLISEIHNRLISIDNTITGINRGFFKLVGARMFFTGKDPGNNQAFQATLYAFVFAQ